MKIIVTVRSVLQPFADEMSPDKKSNGELWARVVAITRSMRKQISEGTPYACRKSISDQGTLDQTKHKSRHRESYINV